MSFPDKFLLVDGSPQTADIISYWLAKEGYNMVYTAETGLNAISKIELINPDIAIINIELPDASGFDLCKHLKEISKHTMILCISHIDSDAYHVRAMESGADDYMDNGDSYEFLSKIRGLLRVKSLSDRIRKQYAELEKRNKLMQRHMLMGRRVQRALIPDLALNIDDFCIRSMYLPAMDVSGDFYNALRLNETNVGIVMGDVSGHGIAASFLTITLNVMISKLTEWHFAPDKLLFHLNNELCTLFEKGHNDPELYACVFYAVVDLQNKTVKHANAGLVLPLLVDGHTGEITELESVGTPIGLIHNAEYTLSETHYYNGDMMFFYTDGLQDCYYKNQPEEFLIQAKDLLSELILKQEDMQMILDTMRQTFYKTNVAEHERMELDDVSMLLCRL
ncbi:MAG: fused response regulator/phosphatase [Defluviitaleaceae bacterium]|nr:fused response regulator/phosphatase [Defluviitaleaceae bacterium]